MNQPQPADTRPDSRISGCVIAILVAVVVVSALVCFAFFARQRSRAEFARQQHERRLRTVEAVKAGRTEVSVSDAELLAMLTDDAECAEKVTAIFFFMADLGDPRFRRVREFNNVKKIGFYDCRNADNMIAVGKEMPNVESLFFEVTGISDRSMQSLAEFPQLKKVRFEQVMPDATIDELKRLLPHVEVDAPWPESKELEYRRKVRSAAHDSSANTARPQSRVTFGVVQTAVALVE